VFIRQTCAVTVTNCIVTITDESEVIDSDEIEIDDDSVSELAVITHSDRNYVCPEVGILLIGRA
jgi:hypothetical protein